MAQENGKTNLCCLSPGHSQLSYVEFRSSNCKTSPLTLVDGRLTAGKNFCASKPCDRTFISAVESVKARRTTNLHCFIFFWGMLWDDVDLHWHQRNHKFHTKALVYSMRWLKMAYSPHLPSVTPRSSTCPLKRNNYVAAALSLLRLRASGSAYEGPSLHWRHPGTPPASSGLRPPLLSRPANHRSQPCINACLGHWRWQAGKQKVADQLINCH